MLEVKWERKEEITLTYQGYIPHPPVKAQTLRKQSTSNDTATIDHWRQEWIDNYRQNHENFGPFKDNSIGELFGKHALEPIICAGAGPSLKNSKIGLIHRKNIPLISCLHNFHFLEDNNTPADYYVTLDAGNVTIEEVYEGGKHDEEHYWELTAGRTLLAYTACNPQLLKKWRGKILFFNCPVPDDEYQIKSREIEDFNIQVGTGGNVLGACLYISKAILGCNPIAYIGADFCFSNSGQFHAWDSKYDAKRGQVMRVTDVYGNRQVTWPSYYNFKCWFEWVAEKVPGIYINCSEGGTLGAFQEGNMMKIQQMPLAHFINMYTMYQEYASQCEKPEENHKILMF